MSATNTCCHECDDVAVNTPGSSGVNAYTTTTADFTIPAIGATVNISVGTNLWMAVGQKIFASDGTDWGTFEVQSFTGSTGVTAEFLGYTDDASPGAVVGSGAKVSPSGVQQDITIPLPIADGGTGEITAPAALTALLSGSSIPIANGGTSGTSKATAIAALGVGQTATVSTLSGLTYDVTNAAAQITGSTLTVPATGSYLVLASVTVLFTGTTFAANRTLTFSVRNTTDAANVITITRDTSIQTTTSQPSVDYVFPFTTQSLTAAKTLQLYASIDTVESAGSTVITAASLCILPIAI